MKYFSLSLLIVLTFAACNGEKKFSIHKAVSPYTKVQSTSEADTEPEKSSTLQNPVPSQETLGKMLIEAVKTSDLAKIKRLQKEGANLKVEDDSKPLTWVAARRGDLSTLDYLLEQKAPVDPTPAYWTTPAWILEQYLEMISKASEASDLRPGVIPNASPGLSDQELVSRDVLIFEKFLNHGSDIYFIKHWGQMPYLSLLEKAIKVDLILAAVGYSSRFTKSIADRGFVLEQIKLEDSQIHKMVKEGATNLLFNVVIDTIAPIQNRKVTPFFAHSSKPLRVRQYRNQSSALTEMQFQTLISLFDSLLQAGADFNGRNLWRPILFRMMFELDPEVFQRLFLLYEKRNPSYFDRAGKEEESTPLYELAMWGPASACSYLRRSSLGFRNASFLRFPNASLRIDSDCYSDILDNIEFYFSRLGHDVSPDLAREKRAYLANYRNIRALIQTSLGRALIWHEYSPRFIEFLLIMGAYREENEGDKNWIGKRLESLKQQDPDIRRLIEEVRDPSTYQEWFEKEFRRYKAKYDSNLPLEVKELN